MSSAQNKFQLNSDVELVSISNTGPRFIFCILCFVTAALCRIGDLTDSMSTIFLILCVCVYWDLMVVGFSDKKASNEWLMWPALPVWESDTRSRSGSSAPQYGERPLSHNSELENVEFPRPLLNPPRHIKHYIYSCFTIKSKLPWLKFPDFVLWWAAYSRS